MWLIFRGWFLFFWGCAVRGSMAILLITAGAVGPVSAEDIPWNVRIGSWNLKNFGESKAGFKNNVDRSALMRRIADISQQDHIIFFQEIQGTGRSVKGPVRGLQHFMPAGWVCNWVSQRSTQRGNGERYSYCLSPSSTYTDGPPVRVTSRVDYLAEGGPYEAVNGSTTVPVTDIWARPPLLTTIEVPLPEGETFEIQVYDNHLKPRYRSGPRVAGVDPNETRNSSVANELLALEKNLRPRNQGALILGDLNADCTYFSEAKKNGKFEVANGWTWWIDFGVRTNVLADAACAYDRFITNAAVTTHVAVSDDGSKKGYEIETQGIHETLNGKLVSDHYKVSLLLEGVKKKQPVAPPAPVPVLISDAGFSGDDSGPSNNTRAKRKHASGPSFPNAMSAWAPNKKTKNSFNAQNLTTWLAAGTSANLYIVKYDAAIDYGGVVDVALKDARSDNGPTPVIVAPDGTFGGDVQWEDAPAGSYKLVLDVNKDGILSIKGGDIVNRNSGIDLLLYPTDFHSNIVTLGDNGLLRELFSEDRARNIYGLATGLAPNTVYTGYVISRKLLSQKTGWKSWADAKRSGLSDLAKFAVPVNQRYGPVLIDELRSTDKVITIASDARGHAFLPIWKKPAVNYNMRALATKPAAVSWRPDPSDSSEEDPCLTAWKGKDENLKTVCNVGHSFSDTYGTAFNFVIDLDHDGDFSTGDLVDTYDIGDMETYFGEQGHDNLGPDANGSPAISEYKDFLNARLNLIPPLDPGPNYTDETKAASQKYACSEYLTRNEFAALVTPDAGVGFHVVDRDVYLDVKNFHSGFYKYENIELGKLDVGTSDAHVCMEIDSGRFGGVEIAENANVEVRMKHGTISGNVKIKKGASLTVIVADGFEVVATPLATALLLTPDPTGTTEAVGGILIGIVGIVHKVAH